MADWYSDEKATMGDRLTAAREHAGLSGRELAQRLGVRAKTVQAWENDERDPRANHLRIMSGMMGVSLMWLLTGDGPGIDEVTPSAEGRRRAARAELHDLQTVLREVTARMARLEKAMADE